MEIDTVSKSQSGTAKGADASGNSAAGGIAGSFANLLKNAGVSLETSVQNSMGKYVASTDSAMVRAPKDNDVGRRNDADDQKDDRAPSEARSVDDRRDSGDDSRVDNKDNGKTAADDRHEDKGADSRDQSNTAENHDTGDNPEASSQQETAQSEAPAAQSEGKNETSDTVDSSDTGADTTEQAAAATATTTTVAAATPFAETVANHVQTARSTDGSGKAGETAQQVAAAARQNGGKETGEANQASQNDGNAVGKTAMRDAGLTGNTKGATNQTTVNQNAAQGGEMAKGPDNQVAAQQAAALSRDARINRPVSVKVTVTGENAGVQSQPTSSLTANAATAIDDASRGGQGQQRGQNTPGNPFAQTSQQAAQAAQQAGNNAAAVSAQQAAAQQAQSQAAANSGGAKAQVNVQNVQQPTSVQATQTGGETLSSSASNGPGQSTQASQTAATQKPAAPQTPVRPQQVMEQVSVQVAKAINGGVDKVTIHLKPESLGRIEVQLEMGKPGRVNATIVVDKQETLDMLRQDVKGLEKALGDAGLDARSGDLNFALRSEQHQNNGRGKGSPDTAPQAGEETVVESGTDSAPALAQAYAKAAAARGGVDIRA
ncbi:MAG: flagellar hook-length control protein FliK [Rhodospirillales bacterium]|nr:flagellar hook-length control protein FliK [Rhodospirillales bacterium]MCW9039310.1 flagellar hook-length control protein FliK [Rhodospirillales bacterium]